MHGGLASRTGSANKFLILSTSLQQTDSLCVDIAEQWPHVHLRFYSNITVATMQPSPAFQRRPAVILTQLTINNTQTYQSTFPILSSLRSSGAPVIGAKTGEESEEWPSGEASGSNWYGRTSIPVRSSDTLSSSLKSDKEWVSLDRMLSVSAEQDELSLTAITNTTVHVLKIPVHVMTSRNCGLISGNDV